MCSVKQRSVKPSQFIGGIFHDAIMILMRRLSIIFFFIGLTCIGVAVSAELLGLDREPGWGRARIITLLLGVLTILCSLLYYRNRDRVRNALHSIRFSIKTHPAIARLLKNQNITYISSLIRSYRSSFPAFVLVILTYIWFVSAGTWTTWISPTRYYADLARGFQRGNLYLPTKVDPHLLELSDPYDPATRGEVEAPSDITFYQGRYYLYWGPVPALILAAVQSFFPGRVGDLFLVFGFVFGILLAQYFLMIGIWDRFFRTLPKWLLFVSILVAGLASPTTFMLDNVNSGRIYEAAITGGQFFFMIALLMMLSAPNQFISNWRLALVSVLWALAIGTRLTLAVPIAVMTMIVAFRILSSQNRSFSKITKLASLGLPLTLGFACLGWYNWARFGSITETGYYYQLAGPHIQKYYDMLFDPAYIRPNSYNYLLNPFQINAQFPFVYPTLGKAEALSPSLPGIYNTQLITGILYTVPFIVFGLIPVGVFVFERFQKTKAQRYSSEDQSASLNWITLMLGVSSLSAFAMLLSFFWAGMRYVEDFMPSLMLLSVIGFWQGYEILERNPTWERIYVVAAMSLASISILDSTLIAISVNNAPFELIRLFAVK